LHLRKDNAREYIMNESNIYIMVHETVPLYPSFLEEKAMNTPDSKQAMRIKWYRLWLNRKICWYAFDHILKFIVNKRNTKSANLPAAGWPITTFVNDNISFTREKRHSEVDIIYKIRNMTRRVQKTVMELFYATN
jgi:hypothetical protein